MNLAAYERRVYSQHGEDGIIDELLRRLGCTRRYYVEIGTEDGAECNTRYLRENGWCGLLIDDRYENPAVNLHRVHVTAENVNALLAQHQVPHDIGLLSIDIDGNDWHIWRALTHCVPRVVVIEYNAAWPPNEDKVIAYAQDFRWDKTGYFGASLDALALLGAYKGYRLVYAEQCGVNCFFVREAEAQLVGAPRHEEPTAAIYRPPGYGGYAADQQRRTWLRARDLLDSEVNSTGSSPVASATPVNPLTAPQQDVSSLPPRPPSAGTNPMDG